jgi:membrane protease YdiL (CAAX protease family)
VTDPTGGPTSNPYGGWPPPGYVHPAQHPSMVPPAATAALASGEYHEIHRTGPRPEWWRPLVGLLVAGVSFLVVQVVLAVGFAVGLLVTGLDAEDALDRLTGQGDATPAYLAFLFVNLAALIPVSIAVTWLIHGQRPGWLVSVSGRIRWRWMLSCFGAAFVALVLTVLVSLVLPAGSDAGSGGEVGGELNEWTSTLRDFLIVVVLLTPLQAAGEEYAFRGYLTQGVGGLFSRINPWAGRAAAVMLPAILFAIAHGAQDAPIFVDRLAFGIVAGVLVITTGGLEAGIAMHILNNLVAFGFALAYGDMASALRPTGGSWWQLPQTLTQSIAFLVLATWAARRAGIATRTTRAAPAGGQVLEGSEPRV